MAWDDSEFTSPDYSTYNNTGDAGGYDQIGNNDLQYNTMDTSNFWDNAPQQNMQDIGQSIPSDYMGMQFGGANENGMFNPMASFQNENPYGSTGQDFAVPQQGMDWGQLGGKGLDALSSIFKGGSNILGASQQQQGSTNSMLKGLASLWAAQQEKKAQGQLGQQNRQVAQQQQQQTNPFAGQRERYQQELGSVQDRLNQFRQNPQANAQYKTLQDQLISQANRGSRQRGTSDVQMAAALAPQLTKSQVDFENQMIQDRAGLYQPAGAGLNGQSGILEALLGANKAGATADSNAAYADAIGRMLQGSSNSSSQDAVLQRLAAALQGQQ